MGWSDVFNEGMEISSEILEGQNADLQQKKEIVDSTVKGNLQTAGEAAKLKNQHNLAIDQLVKVIMSEQDISKQEAFKIAMSFISSDQVGKATNVKGINYPDLITDSPSTVIGNWRKKGNFFIDPTINLDQSITALNTGYQKGDEYTGTGKPTTFTEGFQNVINPDRSQKAKYYGAASSLEYEGLVDVDGTPLTANKVFELTNNTPPEYVGIDTATYDNALEKGYISVATKDQRMKDGKFMMSINPVYESFGINYSQFRSNIRNSFGTLINTTVGSAVLSPDSGDYSVTIEDVGTNSFKNFASLAYDVAGVQGSVFQRINDQVPATLSDEIIAAYRPMLEEVKTLDQEYINFNKIAATGSVATGDKGLKELLNSDIGNPQKLKAIQNRWNSLLKNKDLEELYNLESTELILNENGQTAGYRVYKPFKGIITQNANTGEYVNNVNNLSFSAVQAISKDFINNENGISTSNGEAIIKRTIAERKRFEGTTELKAQGGSDTIDSVVVGTDGIVTDTDTGLEIGQSDVDKYGVETNTSTGTGNGTNEGGKDPNVNEVINDIVWIIPTSENAEELLAQKNQRIQDDYIASGGKLGKDGGRFPQWIREISSEGGALDQKKLARKIKSLVAGFKPSGRPLNPEKNIAELKSMMATEKGGFGDYVSALPEVQSAIEYINSVPEYASLYNVEEDDVNDIASGGVSPEISTAKPMYLGGIMTPRLNSGGTIDETVVIGTRGGGSRFGGFGGLGGRSNSYGLDSYDFSVQDSNMMEKDLAGDRSMSKEEREEEYDKMYNYADTERKKLTVQEMFGDDSEKKSLNSLNVAAIENFKEDLPAAIEAASIEGTVADNPRNIGESAFQNLSRRLVEGDDWLFGGKDTKGFEKYKNAMGVNSNYVFNVPAGLGSVYTYDADGTPYKRD